MPKRKWKWTQAKFQRYMIKEKRGQGEGENYIPWIKVQDSASKGRCHRIRGWKTNRIHHLLSDLEKRAFYLFEWSDQVTDIREQYPLLDLELAMGIASQMKMEYPKDRDNGTPCVLTTDFMLTVQQEDQVFAVARTIKQTKDLQSKRKLEKLELERRYYQALNVDWGIITEQSISKNFFMNMEWIHEEYYLEPIGKVDLAKLTEIANFLKQKLSQEDTTVTNITTRLDEELSLKPGTSLSLFMHLVARKEIILDLFQVKLWKNLPTQAIQKIIYNSDE